MENMTNNVLLKYSYIKKLPNGQYRVLSQKGRNLGTFLTRELAVKRLTQIESFKFRWKFRFHKKKASEDIIDLTNLGGFSYSAILRKLRKNNDAVTVQEFQKIFKQIFDSCVYDENFNDEEIKSCLIKALKLFGCNFKIKIDKDFIKSAAVIQTGDPDQAGKYLSDLVKFLTSRISIEKRQTALQHLAQKILLLNEHEIASKNMPVSASLGQAITLIKNILTDHDAGYIRQVLNNLAKYLAS